MPDDWTIAALKEHYDVRLSEIDRRYDQRFQDTQTAVNAALAAADRAVTKAEFASDKRFDAVNEFRATLADQQRTLMPRPEAEMQFKALHDKLEDVKAAQIKAEGKGGGLAQGWALAAGVVSLVIAIVLVLMKFAPIG